MQRHVQRQPDVTYTSGAPTGVTSCQKWINQIKELAEKMVCFRVDQKCKENVTSINVQNKIIF